MIKSYVLSANFNNMHFNFVAISGVNQGLQIYKACALPSLCTSTGEHTFSVNIGVSSAVANAECCNSDDCNTKVLPCKYRSRFFKFFVKFSSGFKMYCIVNTYFFKGLVSDLFLL